MSCASPSAARSTSMSRAASIVVTCETMPSAPPSVLATHPAQKSSRPSTTSPISSSSSGTGSAWRNASICSSERQSTGADSPVPRGSKPTTSKWSVSGDRKTWPACSAYDVPGAPGPPGLTTSEPTRSDGSSAESRSTSSSMVAPPGSA